MKKLISLTAILLSAFTVSAQVKQEVIASAGGYNKSADNSLTISWTLGETIVPTYTSSDGSLILTHGFQQKLIMVDVEKNLEVPVTVTIYPNPAGESVNIRFETPFDKQIMIQLVDGQGKIIKNDKIEATLLEKTLNLQDIPAGTYFLRLIKGKVANVYKIVKL
ncbi:MAG TPA: T9SS type A sorting domain-containing protein [Bacteroidales bacterium]|nr:T9SS type A sorting domain-containing protein [Bacteroidales bacterium]HRR93606.1 T9SS type A sorting domain-containing protein [Bacteroidales bacterium]HRT88585.1 T9SS type A sorting domain-containing protein [Bacteroidales bacterium]